jgi:hypothetical protein
MQIFIIFSIKPNLRERRAMEDDSTSNEDKDFCSVLFVKKEHEDFIIFSDCLFCTRVFLCTFPHTKRF